MEQVFDGHGGFRAADFAAQHLHKLLDQILTKQTGHIESSLQEAFQELDSRFAPLFLNILFLLNIQI